MNWEGPGAGPGESLVDREWLVTNGLGGYASGSVSGVPTRRYHGYLIAALPAPLGRVVMFNHLTERVILPDGTSADLAGREHAGGDLWVPAASHLDAFGLDAGLPVWRYGIGDVLLEKRVILLNCQNTVHVQYRQVAGSGPVRLELRPSIHPRPHEHPVSEALEGPYALTIIGDRYEVSPGGSLPPLRWLLHGERGALIVDRETIREVFYRVEARRGYESYGTLWSPGRFRADLAPGRDVTLVASMEDWETMLALTPQQALAAELERRRRLIAAAVPAAREGLGAELVLAADQFIITPAGRVADTARATASGDEVRTVIAGYHWFTDWGRDTMISLEGLTLTTGRAEEAGFILRTFAHYIRDGLVPNMFPDGSTKGLYHTADATLWFFHALDRYLRATDDRPTLRLILPTLVDIVDHHRRGTRFGIGVDPIDGLLRQGAEGYQLTWMDAKVEDWVVTPRRGKAVEINALWYNALCLLAGWVREESGDQAQAEDLTDHARRARESFNRRFWYEPGGYLYDVVDGEHGDDASLRPNQLFAISLPHPVLDRERWEPVLKVCEEQLLTPVGLRSLAPTDPDYKPRYDGDLRARDAAYHQGTVWGWLIGPFVDAWLKVHPDDPSRARPFLDGFVPHLSEACLGSISEIFDAEPPFTPRGCIAQAWSVAEVLRCWVKTA
ncbi:MAG: amylo-alpha-1,6-glucosidase [Chloroflexota bacterium]|nr:amylo-alpha-1,6-glucosidase [Chloroflexota bacterium]